MGSYGFPAFQDAQHPGTAGWCSGFSTWHWAEWGHSCGMPALPSPIPIPQWPRDERSPLPSGFLPGVDAVLAAEGILDGEAPIVELQGWEAALIQAHHLAVVQGRCLGAVPWGKGCSGSPRTLPKVCVWGGPGLGMALVGLCQLQCGQTTAKHQPCASAVAVLSLLWLSPDRPHRLQLPALFA